MKKIILLAVLLTQLFSLEDLVNGTTSSHENTNAPMSSFDLGSIQKAYNKSSPVNENVIVYKYDPAFTYKVRTRKLMPTQFVLPEDEKIASYTLGDTFSFTLNAVDKGAYKIDNIFSIESKYSGVDTDLTILGASGRIYSFYIRSDSYESEYISAFVVYISLDGKIPELKKLKMRKPLEPNSYNKSMSLDQSFDQSISTLKNFNWSSAKYGYNIEGGDEELSPIAVFDDGQFTYFQFKDSGSPKYPLVYKVVNGYDVPVNSKVESNYVIVESVGLAWTLRAGESHLCIRHDDYEGESWLPLMN